MNDPTGSAEAGAAPGAAEASAPAGGWSGLAPAAIPAGRLRALVGLGVLGVPATVAATMAVVSGTLPPGPTLAAGAALALVVGVLALAWPGWAFRRWTWRLDEDVLEVRHGVVIRESQLVPLSRLQHVDVQAGPIDRAFGIAVLVVHTAGTHDAAIAVPGLLAADAAALRDRLVVLAAGGDDGV